MAGWGHALLILLAVASPAGANECAILGTKQASDLAIDEPERFEALSRHCRGDAARKPGSQQPLSKGSARPALGGGGAGGGGGDRGGGTKRVDASADSQGQGCPYLFYSVPGKVHRLGTETCQNQKNIVCRLDSKTGTASWEPGGSACVNEPNRIKTEELNLRNLTNTLDGMTQPGE